MMIEPLAPFRVMPIDPQLLRQPLEFLHADLFRLRIACTFLDMLAEDPLREPPLLALALVDYFRSDWPLHLDDMERRLFPLMQGSLLVGDQVDQAIRQLAAEQSRDRTHAAQLLGKLEQVVGRDAELDESSFILRANTFSEAQRRHAAWIEGIILPCAQDRLKQDQLTSLRSQLAAARAWRSVQPAEVGDEGAR
jgi:hypothetical protein